MLVQKKTSPVIKGDKVVSKVSNSSAADITPTAVRAKLATVAIGQTNGATPPQKGAATKAIRFLKENKSQIMQFFSSLPETEEQKLQTIWEL